MTIIAGAVGRLRGVLPERGPGRSLVVVSLLGSLGLGLYQAGSAVYFVRFVGLSAPQVGLGLSVAGLIGLVTGVAVGRLADRLGPRRVAVTAALAKAVPLLFAIAATTMWQFLAVVTTLALAESAWVVANGALVAQVMTGADRVRLSALLRSVTNIGLTAGALAAGAALAIGTRPAYIALLGTYALTSVGEALLCRRLPLGHPRAPEPPVRRRRALRDVPYLAVAFHSNLTTMGDTILTIGLPLWIVTATHVPTAMAAWLLALNTVTVVCLQMRAARSAETVPAARRSQAWALIALVVCCVLIGLAGATPRWPAVVLLVVGVIALTMGEMWGQGARWELRFALAAADAQGDYGATFRLGLLLPRAVGPVLVTGIISQGVGGWLGLGLLFALGVGLNRPVVGWAMRTRPGGVVT